MRDKRTPKDVCGEAKLNAAWLDTDHPKRMAALNSAVADDRMTSQYKQLLQIASNN